MNVGGLCIYAASRPQQSNARVPCVCVHADNCMYTVCVYMQLSANIEHDGEVGIQSPNNCTTNDKENMLKFNKLYRYNPEAPPVE